MRYSDASNEGLLTAQASRESNARSYPRRLPMAIKRARGIEIEDMDGETYYDCLAGAGALALGHNHPEVTAEIQRLLDADRPLTTLDLTTPEKEAFVDALFNSLPAEFADDARIQFCSPAGADAVEAALKLTKTATGNDSVLAFQGAYHGMTTGALSLTGDRDAKAPVAGDMPGVHHLPYPNAYRNPFGLDGDAVGRASSRYLERVLEDPESGVTDPAAVVVELVQGEGGSVPAPDEWTRDLRRITREHDVPLVVDEIQTGLGRTGELYAFEHAGIVPDVVTLSKAVGGGLPLSVVLYREGLDAWEPGAHAGTFRGNQLAMAAGRATIEYVLEHDLADHAAEMGARLSDRLADLGTEHDGIGDVRGRGLFLGVEFVDPGGDPDATGTPPTDGDLAGAVQRACLDRGLIVEIGGRDDATVRFLPPLVVTAEQIDEIATRFREAVEAVLTQEVAS